jgi:hypothetical protein
MSTAVLDVRQVVRLRTDPAAQRFIAESADRASATMAGMSSIPAFADIPGALQSAQLGISRGMHGLARDEQTVADSLATPAGTDALPGALVDSLQQKLLVEASARMMSTVDETLGTLIDIKA